MLGDFPSDRWSQIDRTVRIRIYNPFGTIVIVAAIGNEITLNTRPKRFTFYRWSRKLNPTLRVNHKIIEWYAVRRVLLCVCRQCIAEQISLAEAFHARSLTRERKRVVAFIATQIDVCKCDPNRKVNRDDRFDPAGALYFPMLTDEFCAQSAHTMMVSECTWGIHRVKGCRVCSLSERNIPNSTDANGSHVHLL
jgi:hypothetical protein